MTWSERHPLAADHRFDGGDLDCGNGLLLLIRQNLDPLRPGQLLEILSSESSVEEDLPAWARLTGNELVSRTRQGSTRSYLIRKAGARPVTPSPAAAVAPPQPLARPAAVIAPLSVMGVGSWPRPRWMLQSLHDYLEGRLSEDEFAQTADDAVRLAVAAQERTGADVVSDGEQRRSDYASFVGRRLDNCQLVPITDLLPYVDDPDEFAAELRALDVPADRVRHPAVTGPLRRARPLAVHEWRFAASITSRPVKVALPGPYLLTRTMWLECVSDRFYRQREELADAVVRILAEEACELMDAGAALVQFDEPVLTEVVFGQARQKRSFMCGALGERRGTDEELAFAAELLRRVAEGLPRDRLALHVCRGNWSRDEGVALSGDYGPLLDYFRTVPVGTFFLETCTARAGDAAVLRGLPAASRIGLGVLDQKSGRVESDEEIVARVEQVLAWAEPERLLLNPDCGFATFADSPIAAADVAEAKLAAAARAAATLRRRFGMRLDER